MNSKANFVISVYEDLWIPTARHLFAAEPYIYHHLEKSGELGRYETVTVAPAARQTEEEVVADHSFVDGKYHAFAALLAARFNGIHGTTYSEFFWKKFLALDLLRYVTFLYDLFRMCETHFDPAVHECRALTESSYHLPNDFSEQREFFQSTAFGQEQIFSIYLHCFHAGRFETKEASFAWPEPAFGRRHRLFLARLRRVNLAKVYAKLIAFAFRVRHPRVGIMHGFFAHRHLADIILRSWGRIQPVILRARFQYRSEIDTDMRASMATPEPYSDRFDRFFFASLRYCLPKMCVEAFAEIIGDFAVQFDRFPQLKYVVNEPWIGDCYSAAGVALLQERGVEHIYNEHNFLSHHFLLNNHRYILPLVDRFVTMGWMDDLNPKMVRGGSLREWVLPKKGRRDYKILFISAQPAVKTPEFSAGYGDFGASNAKRHLAFNYEFFGALSASTLSEIIYRGYPLKRHRIAQVYPEMYAYDQEYVLRDYLPQFKLVDSESPSAQQLLSRAGLVVIDYLSTAYIESLLADVPTVFFWNQANYPLEPERADFYSALVSVGICQTTPSGAAAFVERIKDDPESWWRQTSVQSVKNEFLAANLGDPNLLKHYLNELSREL